MKQEHKTNMGKAKLPTIKHKTHSKILIACYEESSSSYKISKILSKAQSNIYEHMKTLEENKYIILRDKNNYETNKELIKKEFLEIINSLVNEITDEEEKKHFQNKYSEIIIQNKYFNDIFNNFFIRLKQNLTSLEEDLTLETIFNSLKQTFSRSSIQLNRYESENDEFEEIKKFQKVCLTLRTTLEDASSYSLLMFDVFLKENEAKKTE